MVLERQRQPLRPAELSEPNAAAGQVQIDVRACGVCRTDLHILDGDLAEPKLPLVPGHQIVGTVRAVGEGVERYGPGDRVGVPWLGWTCGECRYCRSGRENLCDRARFTGYDIDGGYAEVAVYPLEEANRALDDLRAGRFRGAAVLSVASSGS